MTTTDHSNRSTSLNTNNTAVKTTTESSFLTSEKSALKSTKIRNDTSSDEGHGPNFGISGERNIQFFDTVRKEFAMRSNDLEEVIMQSTDQSKITDKEAKNYKSFMHKSNQGSDMGNENCEESPMLIMSKSLNV